jgi:hypothetical protein
MDNALATITGTIAVAALGGLTIVAYKHPKAYKKLLLFLNGITVLGFVGGFSWILSNQWAAIAAKNAAYNLCPGKAYEIRDAVDSYAVPTWLFWAFFGSVLYVQFLSTFPFWLSEEQPPEPGI